MEREQTDIISSQRNPKIKRLLSLQQKSQVRRSEKRFVVEGYRELMHCIQAGYQVESIFVRQGESAISLPPMPRETTIIPVNAEVYERIAYRGSTEGVVAIVESRFMQLTDLQLPPNPLIIVLESVEKPGNLGAVLRSADAAQADAVIVCDPLTEATGLTSVWRQAAHAHIRIPMLGNLDSLNVSVSAAILLFEAVRQRQEQNSQNEE